MSVADSKRFYVTTPIYYVNDKPHIGHAYCTILADVAQRWQRLLGAQSYFLTGTDEHGQKVQEAAEKRGIPPQAHCDELHLAFKQLWPELHCAPNQFIRTTEPRHQQVVQRALQQLRDRGLIVERAFEGWYCVPDERFWTEKELEDGACPTCNRPVVRLQEKNWFFLMSRYQQQLIDALRSGRIQVVPASRANEVLGFLDKPLQDLCISRPKSRLSWGIELPFDRDFVTYVWFDALLNYASAIGFLDAAPPTDAQWPSTDLSGSANFAAWWPHVTHMLGKDILTTHSVYWPTMLMGLAEAFDQPTDAWLPSRLVVTGWWLKDDSKMSKSLGNVVSPLSLKDKYGPEVLRYFLMREMAVGQDANFSEEAVVRRNNADLANDLGNLLQRATALAKKYCDGKVPSKTWSEMRPYAHNSQFLAMKLLGTLDDESKNALPADLQERVNQMEPVAETIEGFRFHKTIADVMLYVAQLNVAISQDKPFEIAKTDLPGAQSVIYAVLDGLHTVAHLLAAVLPETCSEILRRLGSPQLPLTLAELKPLSLPAGQELQEGAPLFPKYEFKVEVEVPAAPQVLQATSPAADAPVGLPAIGIEHFGATELKVGQVLHAEPVPKSTKLLRLQIDLGEPQPRQILSGIAESFAPEQLVGQQVLVLANLAPRKMMGMESRGMVLVAEDADGKRVLVQPQRPVPAGMQVR